MEEINIEPLEEEQVEEKEDGGSARNIIIVVAVIIGMFALFVLGSRFYGNVTSAGIVDIEDLHIDNIEGNLDSEEGYMHNGFSFVKADGLWWTDIKLRGKIVRIPLHFGPRELEQIEFKGTLDPSFNEGDDVYVAINPDVANKFYTLSISELSFNMAKGIDRRPVGSCTKENYACENRTIISCDDTQGKPVIELVLANQTSVELAGTCIKISGHGYDLVKATDRVLYYWYGIMN